ncbi:MAG: hypothetical protein ACLU6Y_15980 [Ruminococcus sp.]
MEIPITGLQTVWHHNAYTDAAHLQAGIQSLGYSQQYPEGYTGHYQFAPEGTEITWMKEHRRPL